MALSTTSTIKPIVSHIITCLENAKRPLFVAFQGPQGSGKTFLTSKVRDILTSPPHNLQVAVLSIDDIYLPHSGLVSVSERHANNKLLAGRGPPGTHDIKLGTSLLKQLKNINDSKQVLQLPFFEKSLFNGEGDRVEGADRSVHPPLDVLLFEGWCVGFCPIEVSEIERKYEMPVEDLKGLLDIKSARKEDILELSELLWEYVEWWAFFDVFVQIAPPKETPYSLIYKWRLQQEHNMKANNGGKGMSDEQVKKFIDRYIPEYIFFSGGIDNGYVDKAGNKLVPSWSGRGLRVFIDENRDLLSIENF